MRKFSIFICSILLIICGIYFLKNKETIINYAIHKYSTYNVVAESNEYTKNKSYTLFSRTNDFTPENYNELINVIYTILDDGMDEFTFYCDYDCGGDIKKITNNNIMDVINNYVHPYNSYSSMHISVNNYNVVSLSIIKTYSENEIDLINNKILDIAKNLTGTPEEKILAFHDYIINNSKYDEESAESNNKEASKASSILFNHTGICGAYTDTLSIFLSYLNINNFKISTHDHIWNALYINDKWYNIDMTWDDPVRSDGKDMLIHDYFLISKMELKNKNDEKHSYNEALYRELN